MRSPGRNKPSRPASLRRSFVTPEGVDLQLELGSAGARAGAFLLDFIFIIILLIVAKILLTQLQISSRMGAVGILWMITAFVVRNGWFALFEMGGRGATPGKRIMGLRVVARDGARLTGGAVIARNAVREIEVLLPLFYTFYLVVLLIVGEADEQVDTFLVIFSLAWSGVFLLFPLFNRDRLRVGDLIAGTWVVRTVSGTLGHDLVAGKERPRRTFSDAALNLYGVKELQTLEEVLRNGRDEAIATVAWTIRNKAGIADDGDDFGFLSDYYAALCARLERGLMLGRRREDKFATSRG
jgi:uncharacterized RDD family membrane protein YckC